MIKFFKGLALCVAFMTVAMIAGVACNQWFGVDTEVVWFIFGVVYADAVGRAGL